MAKTTLDNFTVIKKLGEGAYSSVFHVLRKEDSKEYGLKKVKMQGLSDKERENAINEVRILASIKNFNVISYKEAFADEGSDSLCIVMEYANNGDLFQKIQVHQKESYFFNEGEIWKIFIQVVFGLKALHDLKIMHRDIKSANVFLYKDQTAKLGDMNVSKVANKNGLNFTQTGTPYYASPEVWRDEPYSFQSDIWSLGCVLYEMITLKPPFTASDMQGLFRKVTKGQYPRISKQYTQDLAYMVKWLLQVKPENRPTCDQLAVMPIFARRTEKYFPQLKDQNSNVLMRTIKVPNTENPVTSNYFLTYLSDKLPKSNYEDLQYHQTEGHHAKSHVGERDFKIKHPLYKYSNASESHSELQSDKNSNSVLLPSVKSLKNIYAASNSPYINQAKKKQQMIKMMKNKDLENSYKIIDEDQNYENDDFERLDEQQPINLVNSKLQDLSKHTPVRKRPIVVEPVLKQSLNEPSPQINIKKIMKSPLPESDSVNQSVIASQDKTLSIKQRKGSVGIEKESYKDVIKEILSKHNIQAPNIINSGQKRAEKFQRNVERLANIYSTGSQNRVLGVSSNQKKTASHSPAQQSIENLQVHNPYGQYGMNEERSNVSLPSIEIGRYKHQIRVEVSNVSPVNYVKGNASLPMSNANSNIYSRSPVTISKKTDLNVSLDNADQRRINRINRDLSNSKILGRKIVGVGRDSKLE